MKKFLTILATILACIFITACTPSNVEKAESKMKDAGYTVSANSDYEAEGIIGAITATKGGLLGEKLIAILFDTKENAAAFAEDGLIDLLDPIVDGKWVYWGNEAAIEAFKK